jgi:hypothetical protein
MTRLLVALTCVLLAAPVSANRRFTSGIETSPFTMEPVSSAGTQAPTRDTGTMRSGVASLKAATVAAGTSYVAKNTHVMGSGDVWSVRVYIYITDMPDSDTSILYIGTSGGSCWGLWLRTTGAMQLRSSNGSCLVGSGTQVGSDSSLLSASTWYRIEIQAAWDGNACSARIDGSQFASGSCEDVSGSLFRFGIGVNSITSANTTIYFDDFAWNDDNGSAQTSFAGEGKVGTLYVNGNGATTDNGTQGTDWETKTVTGQSASTAIDDGAAIDDGTTYLDFLLASAGTGGDPPQHEFIMGDFSTIGGDSNDTITLVAASIRVAAETAAAASYVTRIRSSAGGTATASATISYALTQWQTDDDDSSIQAPKVTAYTDPQDGAAWTPTDIDNLRLGIYAPDATPDIHVSAMWAVVEYVAVAAPGGGTEKRLPVLGVGPLVAPIVH